MLNFYNEAFTKCKMMSKGLFKDVHKEKVDRKPHEEKYKHLSCSHNLK